MYIWNIDKAKVGDFVSARIGGVREWGSHSAIGLERDGELIAGVVYEGHQERANVSMHVAAKPGAIWMRPEFLRVWFSYPFLQLNVRRVTGLVDSKNLAAIRLNEHLGFKLEATLEGATTYGDLLVYRMFRDECRWVPASEDRNESTLVSSNPLL